MCQVFMPTLERLSGSQLAKAFLAKEVWQFLGLVQYLAAFLPQLAMHTGVLNKLTDKDSQADLPEWSDAYKHAFQTIKTLVVNSDCLTGIDHSKMPTFCIFLTIDASNYQLGTMPSFGKD
jgi:hypothetical protein